MWDPIVCQIRPKNILVSLILPASGIYIYWCQKSSGVIQTLWKHQFDQYFRLVFLCKHFAQNDILVFALSYMYIATKKSNGGLVVLEYV